MDSQNYFSSTSAATGAYTSGYDTGANEAGPSNYYDFQQQTPAATDPYACTWPGCDYVAKDQRELTKHMRRKHELPEGCLADRSCDHRTAELRDMQRHYWVAHKSYAKKNNIPEENADCPKCPRTFTRRDNMLKHYKKQHDNRH